MKDFEYFAAKTVEEACSLLSQYKEEANIIAGGQSLLTLLRQKLISPSYLIDIKDIPDLDYIKFDEKDGLRIGALTTHRAIELSPLIKERFSVLAEMERVVASVQTRNWGTIGGNLCHADPIGDPAPPLIALNARVKIVSSRGERIISLEDFFKDYFTTVLEADEILAEIQIPNPPPHSGVAYIKFSIIEAGIKIAAASALITLDGKATCKDARIVLSAVAPVPMRAKEAAKLLVGKSIDDNLIEQAAEMASKEASPTSDVHASEEYRRELAKVLVRRVTKQALERAKTA